MSNNLDSIIRDLRSRGSSDNVKGMAKFGINSRNTLGVSMPALRRMAKEIGTDHVLALGLWDADIHDGRILACLIDDPGLVTPEQMERWVEGFDSWDVCDQCCSNLFDKTRFAYDKAFEWARRREEFIKRAGFVLMAALAVHDKKASDERIARFLPVIEKASTDDRNFVRKGVNWALRQIGKRNRTLNRMAIEAATRIAAGGSGNARWIASDALRELKGEKVRERLGRMEKKVH